MARSSRGDKDDNVKVVREQAQTRGGVSFVSIITGIVVAIGAFVVLTAIVGGILAAMGVAEAAFRRRRFQRPASEPASASS